MWQVPFHQIWLGPLLFAAGAMIFVARERLARALQPVMPHRWPVKTDAVFSSVFLMTFGAALFAAQLLFR